MAAGDIVFFDQFRLDLGKKLHDLSADSIKLALVTSTVTPSKTTADPRWGSGGSTNLSSNQVSTAGTSYVTGGTALSSRTWTIAGTPTARPVLRAANITWAQDASGPTNARWGILYNDTDSGKRAIGYVDLGSDRSLVSGPLTIDWNGTDGEIWELTDA